MITAICIDSAGGMTVFPPEAAAELDRDVCFDVPLPYEELDQELPDNPLLGPEWRTCPRWINRAGAHRTRCSREVRQGRPVRSRRPYGAGRDWRAPKFSHIPGVDTREGKAARRKHEERVARRRRRKREERQLLRAM
jgi:hypothetical protein